MVYVISLSVPMCDHSQVLSLFTSILLISHLPIFSRNLDSSSFLELHALLLQPSSFFPYLLQLCNTQESQPPLENRTVQWSSPVSFPQPEPTIYRYSPSEISTERSCKLSQVGGRSSKGLGKSSRLVPLSFSYPLHIEEIVELL